MHHGRRTHRCPLKTSAMIATPAVGQEPGGAGLPDDGVDGVALATDFRAPVALVEVLDVESEDLAGAGGAFVEHPPHGLLPQGDVFPAEQVGDLLTVQGPGA